MPVACPSCATRHGSLGLCAPCREHPRPPAVHRQLRDMAVVATALCCTEHACGLPCGVSAWTVPASGRPATRHPAPSAPAPRFPHPNGRPLTGGPGTRTCPRSDGSSNVTKRGQPRPAGPGTRTQLLSQNPFDSCPHLKCSPTKAGKTALWGAAEVRPDWPVHSRWRQARACPSLPRQNLSVTRSTAMKTATIGKQ